MHRYTDKTRLYRINLALDDSKLTDTDNLMDAGGTKQDHWTCSCGVQNEIGRRTKCLGCGKSAPSPEQSKKNWHYWASTTRNR